jgi:hypothetical protein
MTLTLQKMSIAEIKSEIDRLSPEDLQHLKAYVAVRQDMLDPEFRKRLARKIDDKSSENWMTLDEDGKKLFP